MKILNTISLKIKYAVILLFWVCCGFMLYPNEVRYFAANFKKYTLILLLAAILAFMIWFWL